MHPLWHLPVPETINEHDVTMATTSTADIISCDTG